MSIVGTVVRAPGIVDIAVGTTSTIVRGFAVTMDSSTKLAKVAGATDRVYGIATSDADLDTNRVPVAVRGGYTVAIKPAVGITFANGDIVYYDNVGVTGAFTNVAGSGTGATIIGWVVDNRVDAQGNVEMAYMTL